MGSTTGPLRRCARPPPCGGHPGGGRSPRRGRLARWRLCWRTRGGGSGTGSPRRRFTLWAVFPGFALWVRRSHPFCHWVYCDDSHHVRYASELSRGDDGMDRAALSPGGRGAAEPASGEPASGEPPAQTPAAPGLPRRGGGVRAPWVPAPRALVPSRGSRCQRGAPGVRFHENGGGARPPEHSVFIGH